MKTIQLTYTSIPSVTLTDEDVQAIAAQSRINNHDLGVTGFLVYRPGRFSQVLEGPPDVVTELFAKIALDPRHEQCVMVGMREVMTRRFPVWSMGYVSVQQEIVKMLESKALTLPADDHDKIVKLALDVSGLVPAS